MAGKRYLYVMIVLCLFFCGCAEKKNEVTRILYGRETLKNDAERSLYDTVAERAQQLVPQPFSCDSTVDPYRVLQIVDICCFDHPEIFWIDEQMSCSFDSGTVTLNYRYEGDVLQQMKERQEEVIAGFVNTLPAEASLYEKELCINDFILDICEYAEVPADKLYTEGNINYAYGAAVDGRAVCGGYAKAFKMLCDRCGIPCVVVLTIDEDTGIRHAVDAVQLDGEWYYCDPTNCDFDDYIPELRHRTYFNITTEILNRHQTVEPTYAETEGQRENIVRNTFVPVCTADTYNWMRRSFGEIPVSRYQEELIPAVSAAAKEKREYFAFRVPESEDYDHFRNWLFAENHVHSLLEAVNAYQGNDPYLDTQADGFYFVPQRLIAVELRTAE